MKTAIFEKNNMFEGVVEYKCSADKLRITYSVKPTGKAPKQIYKLYALSSSSPLSNPICVDTLDFSESTATGDKTVSAAEFKTAGFDCSDIDTFAIVSDSHVAACCFEKYSWRVCGVFEKNSLPYKPDIENPIDRANRIMENFKAQTSSHNPSNAKFWIDSLKKACGKLDVSNNKLPAGYTWYTVKDIRPPIPLSSYRHILFTSEAVSAFDSAGEYCIGISEDGHTALAVKSAAGMNPFANASDCAVMFGGFQIVGILLAADGQYFEKPIIKDYSL